MLTGHCIAAKPSLQLSSPAARCILPEVFLSGRVAAWRTDMSRDRETDPRDLLRAIVRPRFQLGKVLATPGALEAIPMEEMRHALGRHWSGDWGDLEQEDRDANDRALEEGSRLFSAYKSSSAQVFWVITEADRSVSTVLLPEEY